MLEKGVRMDTILPLCASIDWDRQMTKTAMFHRAQIFLSDSAGWQAGSDVTVD